MDETLAANQSLWNRWTPLHVRSAFYDVAGFKAGRDTLGRIELESVGDVRGKSLLHLQCHFGLDSLSWARRGARVTGVDFSQEAIHAARDLAQEMNLPAEFVQSEISELPNHLSGEFDVVFTSGGVLGWLPDLATWARVIAHFLRPGGIFSLVEVHPLVSVFDDERTDRELHIRYPYFPQPTPLEYQENGSYAVPEAPVHATAYYWAHSLEEILGTLLGAGLRIEAFVEHPFMEWAYFPWMERGPDRFWRLPTGMIELPLMFSLLARKEDLRVNSPRRWSVGERA